MIARSACCRSQIPTFLALATMSLVVAACPRDDITVGGPAKTSNDGGPLNADADDSTKGPCETLAEQACFADVRCRWLEANCNRDNPSAPTGCFARDAIGCGTAGAECAAGFRCVIGYVSNCGGPGGVGSAACARCADEVRVCAAGTTLQPTIPDAGTTPTKMDADTQDFVDCTTLPREDCRRQATCKWLETTCYPDREAATGCFHLGDLECVDDASCGVGRRCLTGAVSNCPVTPVSGGPTGGQCAICASEVRACTPARSAP